jgi:hypothetical protein
MRSGFGELVALALDEVFEGVVAIESPADRGADSRCPVVADRFPRRACRAADLNPHRNAGHVAQTVLDTAQTVAADPVDHEAVGRE